MSQQKSKEQPAASDIEAAPRIRFNTNVIVPTSSFEGSIFIRRGEPTPFASAEDVPENLKAYIAEPSEADAEPEQRFANFSPNIVYQAHPDGGRGRALRHEVAELSQAVAEQEWAEQAAEAQAALDKETEAILQEAHDVHIAIAIKTAEIAARDRDGLPAAIMAERDEEAKQEAEPKPGQRRRK
jgi:hypothetical protein